MMEELEDIDDFYLSIQSDFIYFWCKEYGLPDMVVEHLDKSGCRSLGDLMSLTSSHDLEEMILTNEERYLLKHALQRYRKHPRVVNEIVQRKVAENKVEMLNKAREALKMAKSENQPQQAELAKRILMKPIIFEEIQKKREMEERIKDKELAKHDRGSLLENIMRTRQNLGIRCESAPAVETPSYLSQRVLHQRSATSTPGLLQHRRKLSHTVPRQYETAAPPVEQVTYNSLRPPGERNRKRHKFTSGPVFQKPRERNDKHLDFSGQQEFRRSSLINGKGHSPTRETVSKFGTLKLNLPNMVNRQDSLDASSDSDE